MSSYVLCIFEGQKTEQNIAENLCKHFLNDGDKVILRASYGFNIYQLFESVSQDEFFDTYELIVEQLKKRKTPLLQEEEKVIAIEDPSKISDIYLFFDYDCHCSNANDEKLSEMLKTFNDSQDRGLLCVSYPMVEAIRHQFNESPLEILHSIEELDQYKKWINTNETLSPRYFNWGLYDLITWKEIINQHLIRANYLITNLLELPKNQIEQLIIFNTQIEKHIPEKKVAVISSFPLMLFEYYGSNLIERITT
ncbi:TPA: hypothetical protein NJY83_001381 [Vibrio parahaemolyticus]|uniref:hypothetical protein n=1 Tax=Vibrio parahaemolyticus TaxID=670 RepID=UPI001C9CC5D1|nr:hypothetical protein [Vibrio parahaemolyticus]MBY7763585.1 hypothetical protein [Vibrio fluvialis]MBY7772244.1 hypothetical protein [Vibrio fluvialis]MBY7777619.1 hypothetical protein [Vibrio fluvialis]MBY7841301.1 hypothetical protein [Vibrio fluvialis]MBY7985815.1 hypothetical protein [Vibrio fluvialis]